MKGLVTMLLLCVVALLAICANSAKNARIYELNNDETAVFQMPSEVASDLAVAETSRANVYQVKLWMNDERGNAKKQLTAVVPRQTPREVARSDPHGNTKPSF